TSTGRPSARKTSDFTIWAVVVPTAAAASRAVRVPAGIRECARRCPLGGEQTRRVQRRKSCFTHLRCIPDFLTVAFLEQFAHADAVACKSPRPPPRDLPARKTTREWGWWRSRGATWRRAVAAV